MYIYIARQTVKYSDCKVREYTNAGQHMRLLMFSKTITYLLLCRVLLFKTVLVKVFKSARLG